MRLSVPKLNQKQIEKLSDIASDLALVSTASVILPAAFDKFDPTKILLGSTVAIAFWLISLLLRRYD